MVLALLFVDDLATRKFTVRGLPQAIKQNVK
jgi:hypothetical protein